MAQSKDIPHLSLDDGVDDYAQRFLERAMERSQELRSKLRALEVQQNIPVELVSYQDSPKVMSHMERDTVPEFQVQESEKSPLKKETHQEGNTTEEEEDKENVLVTGMEEPDGSVSERTKQRLQKLGKLYGGTEFDAERAARSARLAAFAQEMNQREDDLRRVDLKSQGVAVDEGKTQHALKVQSMPRPDKKTLMSPMKGSKSQDQSEQNLPPIQEPKQHSGDRPASSSWDPVIIQKLEAQGFKHSDSKSRLIYEFQEVNERKGEETVLMAPSLLSATTTLMPSDAVGTKEEGIKVDTIAKKFGTDYNAPPPPPKLPSSQNTMLQSSIKGKVQSPTKVQTSKVASIAAKFNSGQVIVQREKEKSAADPSQLSLAARKALFENKDSALPVPTSMIPTNFPPSKKHLTVQAVKNAPIHPLTPAAHHALAPLTISKPIEMSTEQQVLKQPEMQQPGSPQKVAHIPSSPMKATGSNTVAAQRMLFENVEDGWKKTEIYQATQAQRQQEMETVLHRWNQPPSARTNPLEPLENPVLSNPPQSNASVPKLYGKGGIPVPPALPPPPQQAQIQAGALSKSPQKEWQVPKRPGRLYPALSDLESEQETEAEAESSIPSSLESSTEPGEEQEEESEDEPMDRDLRHHSPVKRRRSYYQALESLPESETDKKVSIKENDIWGGGALEACVSLSMTPTSSVTSLSRTMDSDNYPTPPKQKCFPSPKNSPQQVWYFYSSHGLYLASIGLFKGHNTEFDNCGRQMCPRMEPQILESEETKNSNTSVTLVHTISFYRRQKPVEVNVTPVQQIVRQAILPPDSPEEDIPSKSIPLLIQELQNEVEKQQSIIHQACNALNVCKTTAEFQQSVEQVEGERLLLVATEKKKAALNEIQRLKSEGAVRHAQDQMHGPRPLVQTRGSLTLMGLALHLKEEFFSYLIEGGDNSLHHFIILVRHRGQVIPTQMLTADEHGIQKGWLVFPNDISLHDLEYDFMVSLEVYALQSSRKNLDHRIKYHIKKEKSTLRLTPKKKKQESHMKSPMIGNPASSQHGSVKLPAFGLVGVTHINIANISEHKRQLQHEPIGSVDLRQCITEEFKNVRRDRCSRNNTFLLAISRPSMPADFNNLVTERKGHETIISYLLSADTKEEMQYWCKQLSRAVSDIRAWDPEALRPKPEGSPEYLPTMC
ncbi:unnamed protein product [Darwinula stevensoni]|uniref:Anillin homology domain-containing protein n=1 Tax=Darwinula stevensoni TaxID=69355 RepID=A0A7R9A6W5_9CRUS|nr:unnamed protein product [Darwinula stevensoni]CAG0890573.1 unnamed protein product [Darwinula stevensoni]